MSVTLTHDFFCLMVLLQQVFRRKQQDLEKLSLEQLEASKRELAELERKFLERVAQSNRAKSSAVGGAGGGAGTSGYEHLMMIHVL